MEEGALAVARFLTRLIMPIGVIAGAVGLLTIVKGLAGFRRPQHSESGAAGREAPEFGRGDGSLLERAAASLCGTIAVVLILLFAANVGRRSDALVSPWTAAVVVMLLLLAAPAILWNTRYRMVGEGIATVVIAGIAILTGFSVGFLFVPVVLLMIWLCIEQLRPSKPRAESDRSSG